jgi:2,4-dienoyl-CoA reductase (NADPH2)
MTTRLQAQRHRQVTDAVHEQGGAIAMQVLHAGRYGYTPFSVSASAIKAPINPFRPSALSTRGVDRTVSDFARAARLAQRAGYDAVEIMGSEGYLVNQFLAARTNRRTDAWGGTAEKRMRFPVEIVRRTREAVGDGFPVIYRLSLLDLVEGGQTWDEVVELAHRIEDAGATVINTGIGWHEARVPTIITQVPRGAWTWATERLKAEVSVPVCASNRINTPQLADRLIADGTADLVSMARPLLADPDFVNKAAAEREDEIITCIACNQACLDHVFKNQKASCMLNPRAGRETEIVLVPTLRKRQVAVVGGGPAGLAAAAAYAERGDAVTLFEKGAELGGQFRLAMQIPGKEEFAEALRYYRRQLEIHGVEVRLNTTADPEALTGFDEVVVATGVVPRVPAIPGIDHPKVVLYSDVLDGSVEVGRRVAVIGAGGIGVDVAHYLTHDPTETTADWLAHWGVGDPAHGTGQEAGGLAAPTSREPVREVTLVQRKTSIIGKSLGKTSGWAHRAVLKQAGVTQVSGATYDLVDDRGLHLTVDGEQRVIEVDHVVVCAGQESVRDLYDALLAAHAEGRTPTRPHIIGGADVAAELDAKRAIEQGVRLAAG